VDTKDILLNCFADTLKLAQKTIYLGLLFSSLSLLISVNVIDHSGLKIPLLEAHLESKSTLVILLFILYFLNGLLFSFYALRCRQIKRLIKNDELIYAAGHYPTLLTSGKYFRLFTTLSLMMLWAPVFVATWGLSWYHFPLIFIVTSPYAFAMVIGENIAV
jgi:hypothetical protein